VPVATDTTGAILAVRLGQALTHPPRNAHPVSTVVPFEPLGGHLITVPVQLGDSPPTKFILDTGIGLNLVSSEVCSRFGYPLTGNSHVGRRMSGQAISVPLAVVPSIRFGSVRKENVLIGVVDLDGFLPPGTGVEGFLSPQFFEPWVFTISRSAGTVSVEPTPRTPDPLHPAVEVPVKVVRDGGSIAAFVDLQLPNGHTISVEVDTGSDTLILHSRYMAELDVREGGPGVSMREGTDETGHRYTRYFSRVSGPIAISSSPSLAQQDPEVMFQDIIYDGLVGDSFLRAFDVTYDLTRSRMLFAKHPP
jgi:hypothetical protein